MTLYPEQDTLETDISYVAHRPGTIPSPNLDSPSDLDSLLDYYGDCPSSGGIQLSNAQSPFVEWEPLITYNGIKWVPTITLPRSHTCRTCPVYAECAADVFNRDFAWCEDIIPADYQLTNPNKAGYRNFELKTDN